LGFAVQREVKIRAIITVGISMGLSCWIVDRPILCLMLFTIGAAVSIFLLHSPEAAAENLD